MAQLTHYKPEVKTVTGRPQACMQTCEDGAWLHYKEVEELLKEKEAMNEQLRVQLDRQHTMIEQKDKEILELKEKLSTINYGLELWKKAVSK